MKHSESYVKLADFGRALLDRVSSLEEGLPMISDYAKEVVGAERCSIYVYSPRTNMLWTTLSDGISKIIISADTGIAGMTLAQKKPLLVNDPYNDPNFYNKVDRKSGFTTTNMASVPVLDSDRKVIGVLQLLNKTGGFDDEDLRFMTFFAHYISGYLELASLFQEDQEYLIRDKE